MQIRVNGAWRSINGPTTVQGLLEELGYRDCFVAVAVNEQCIPLQQFQQQPVADQDEIEILAPMAGG